MNHQTVNGKKKFTNELCTTKSYIVAICFKQSKTLTQTKCKQQITHYTTCTFKFGVFRAQLYTCRENCVVLNWFHRLSHRRKYNSNCWAHCLNSVLMVFNYHYACVNANQLRTSTCYYMHECQDSFIQCPASRGFVSIQIPWFYSPLLRITKTVQHTSAQFISTFSALILAND